MGPRTVCAHIHHQSFPFDVGASAFCLVRRGLFGFKAAFISGRVKSVLLIILLSADMVCEVASNELLLCVAAAVLCIYLSMRRCEAAAASPMTPFQSYLFLFVFYTTKNIYNIYIVASLNFLQPLSLIFYNFLNKKKTVLY